MSTLDAIREVGIVLTVERFDQVSSSTVNTWDSHQMCPSGDEDELAMGKGSLTLPGLSGLR